MSKQFDTKPRLVYTATLTQAGTIHAINEDGSQVLLVESSGAGQVQFLAISRTIIVSDDSVVAVIPFPNAATAGLGGGGTDMAQHLRDSSHLSAAERRQLEYLIDAYATPQPTLPEGALPWPEISDHFRQHAQPGVSAAPAAVYAVRVPLAYSAGGNNWNNTASMLDETATGLLRKLFDNAGLASEQSTDLVVGRDDYAGLWAFYWQHANYTTDAHGVKHLTAIKEVHRAFDAITENVCAFGPAFWFFCKEERSQQNGVWTTHDGTETGKPLYQVWGITSRPWAELPAEKKAQLESVGVGESDLALWPECLVWDEGTGEPVKRPYWCHSAYCGGAEKQANGTYKMVSKKNLPLYNNLSYKTFCSLYGNAAGFGGSAQVQAFGLLFDLLKTGNKNSQSAHTGMNNNYNDTVAATHDTLEAGYIWPVSSRGCFVVGGTVQLMQQSGNTWDMTYRLSKAIQQARIAAIETREFSVLDGTSVSSLCLVFDPATCQPFRVRVAAADAQTLAEAGEHAHSFAVQGMALTGETDAVPYPHDGSMTSCADGRHPFRTMGTEYMPGIWMIGADVVALINTEGVSVTINGVSTTPNVHQFVILHAGFGVKRKTSGTLRQYLDAGYEAVGLMPATPGWILNMQLTREGVAYPIAVGGSDTLGHGDYVYAGIPIAGCVTGGHAKLGATAGLAACGFHLTMERAEAFIGGRD